MQAMETPGQKAPSVCLDGAPVESRVFHIQYTGYVSTKTSSKKQPPDASHAEGAHLMMTMLPPHALPETARRGENHNDKNDACRDQSFITDLADTATTQTLTVLRRQLLVTPKSGTHEHEHEHEHERKGASVDAGSEPDLDLPFCEVVSATAFDTSIYVMTKGDATGVFLCHRFVTGSETHANAIVSAILDAQQRHRSATSSVRRSLRSRLSHVASRLRGRSSNSHAASTASSTNGSSTTSPLRASSAASSKRRLDRPSQPRSLPESCVPSMDNLAALGSTPSMSPPSHSSLTDLQRSCDGTSSPSSTQWRGPFGPLRKNKSMANVTRSRSFDDSLDDLDTALFAYNADQRRKDSNHKQQLQNDNSGRDGTGDGSSSTTVTNTTIGSTSDSSSNGCVTSHGDEPNHTALWQELGCHGEVSFADVDRLLQPSTGAEPGTWLLRATPDPSIPFVVSFLSRHRSVKHISVFHTAKGYKLSGLADTFEDPTMLLAHVRGMQLPLQGHTLGRQVLPAKPVVPMDIVPANRNPAA